MHAALLLAIVTALAWAAAFAALNPFARDTLRLCLDVALRLALPYLAKGGFETRLLVVERAGGRPWRLRLPGWSARLEIRHEAERATRYAWL